MLVSVPENQLVNDFVLLVDEIKRLHDHLVKTDCECASLLRKCLLDTSLTLFKCTDTGSNINMALVISSLDICATGGTTESSRAIITLELPERLDALQVVEKWWKIAIGDAMRKQFYLLANLLNNIPRYCEEVFESVVKSRVSDKTINMKKLLIDVQKSINTRYWYDTHNYPSSAVMRNIIFQEEIQLNKDVLSLINKSIISNSIANFEVNADTQALVPIIPQASALVLMSLKEKHDNPISKQFHFILEDIQNLNFLDKSKIGELLETLFRRWLIIRSYVCILTKERKSHMTLNKLLGIYILRCNDCLLHVTVYRNQRVS